MRRALLATIAVGLTSAMAAAGHGANHSPGPISYTRAQAGG
jgi:hypothetical protein